MKRYASEALARLKGARRLMLEAMGDVGDLALGGRDGSPTDQLHNDQTVRNNLPYIRIWLTVGTNITQPRQGASIR